MSLKVYCGCMFSSKSSTLLSELTKYADISENRHILLINHSLDTRDSSKVSSHSSMYKGISNKIDLVSTNSLKEVDVSNYSVVGIDEASFFDDLPETVKYWLTLDKHIICAGIDSDFQMKPFGRIHELVYLADSFIKLNAVCSVCNKGQANPLNVVPAAFTERLTNSGNLIEIGGSESYIAVCRKHHSYSKI